MEKKRNYSIDFLRMIFIICICIHHLQAILGIKYINSAYLCVEFFFILSGFYLYKSYKKNENITTVQYTEKKIKRMYPHYIFALFIMIAEEIIIENNFNFVKLFFTFISESLMLQSVGGFLDGLNTPLWYFSVLIVAGFIIYELLRKFKDQFIKIIAPIITIFYLGLVNSNGGKLEIWECINGIYMPFLRGFADIAIGCMLAAFYNHYESNLKKQSNSKILAIMIEGPTIISLGYLIVYNTKYELYSVILFSIIIFFANESNSIISKLFNKKFFKNYGDLTYAMFLNHAVIIKLIKKIEIGKYISNNLIIFVGYIIIVMLYSYLTDKLIKYLVNRKNKDNKSIT